MPNLTETLQLATLLHDGVTDCTGQSYIEHPLWVMNQLPPHVPMDFRYLALLHDTIEDCQERLRELIGHEMQMSVSDLEAYLAFFRHRGYTEYLIDGLRLITRDFWPNLTYLDYIRQIAASGHLGTICVKMIDNQHNSNPERITRVLPEFRERVVGTQTRYARSLDILRPAFERLQDGIGLRPDLSILRD